MFKDLDFLNSKLWKSNKNYLKNYKVIRRFRASNYHVSSLSLTSLEHDQSQTIHLYNAYVTRWGMESDPIQLVRLHKKGVWNKLHWDAEVSSYL